MRVTCDTNVLVRAAVRPAGPARAVLVETTAPPHVLVLSEQIIAELSRVLRYERVQRQLRLTDDAINELVAGLRAVAELAVPPEAMPKVSSDDDDNIVIATAVAGKADAISSRDRHLRHRLVQAYCATYGIRVLTDLELLAELRL